MHIYLFIYTMIDTFIIARFYDKHNQLIETLPHILWNLVHSPANVELFLDIL